MKKVVIHIIILNILVACRSTEIPGPSNENCAISSIMIEYINGTNSNFNGIDYKLLGNYFYNSKGHLIYTNLPDDLAKNTNTSFFVYDSNDFLIKIKIPSSTYILGTPPPIDTSTTILEYNSQNLLSKFSYPIDGTKIKVNTNITYDAKNRISMIKRDFDGKTVFEYNFISGKLSSYINYTYNVNYRVDYTTNSFGFITKEDFGNYYILYNYDSNNNLSQINTYNNGVKSYTINYKYDNKKNPNNAKHKFKGINFPLNLNDITKTLTTLSQNNVLVKEEIFNDKVQQKRNYSYEYNNQGLPTSINSITTYPNSTNKNAENTVKQIYTYNCN